VAEERADALISDLIGRGVDQAAIIGRVTVDPAEKIFVD
jgi:hypothetical protein